MLETRKINKIPKDFFGNYHRIREYFIAHRKERSISLQEFMEIISDPSASYVQILAQLLVSVDFVDMDTGMNMIKEYVKRHEYDMRPLLCDGSFLVYGGEEYIARNGCSLIILLCDGFLKIKGNTKRWG